MEKKYVKTNYTGCSYITAGKVYEVTESDGKYCWIVDDQGERIYIIADEASTCCHLDSVGFWEDTACAVSPTTGQQEEKMEQEYKTFGEMSKEEKLALFEAWLKGAQIQVYSTANGFVDVHFPIWSEAAIYRIKPVPVEMPSIDWSHVHPDYKWLAVDESGNAFLYMTEPEKLGVFWNDDIYEAMGAAVFSSYKRGNVAWDESLVKRPEGV